jgi:hypothetical protein
VHGACSTGLLSTPVGATSGAVHGQCTPIRPSKELVLPATGINSQPMTTLKRSYVHMVTPTRSAQKITNISPLPMSVKDSVSTNDSLIPALINNGSVKLCSNIFASQAVEGTKRNITPDIMNTPVSKSFSHEEVIAFGGIKSQEANGIRSSGRLRAQPNADATQLQKAMLLAQRRNESFSQGTTQSHSLLNFSETQIIHNATALGVSMGSSITDQINAAQLIKENEFQRTLTILKNKEAVVENNGENVSCLIVSRASELVVDLDDEDHLVEDGLLCVSPVANKPRRNKKKISYDKNKVRRSNRIRTKNHK